MHPSTQSTKLPNFTINFSEIDVRGESLSFGKTVRFTIPQNIGHLLKSVTLVIKADDIPEEWNCDDIQAEEPIFWVHQQIAEMLKD